MDKYKCYTCKNYKEYHEEFTLIENECIENDLMCFDIQTMGDCKGYKKMMIDNQNNII